MSDSISISLSSGALRFLSRLKDLPESLRQPVIRTLDKQNQLTIGRLSRLYLSRRGPSTLGVVTNRLRSSIRASAAHLAPDGAITASIGSNVKYAGVHEFGFDGEVKVRAHTRRLFETLKATTQTVSIDPKTGHWRFGKKRRQRQLKKTAQVRSFSRRMRMPARPYIRRGIAERRQQYTDALEKTIFGLI